MFSFDENRRSDAAERKFGKLMQELREKEAELSIKCHVIASDNEVEIGGRPWFPPYARLNKLSKLATANLKACGP